MLLAIFILGVLNLFWVMAICFALQDARDYLRAIAHPFLEADEAVKSSKTWLSDDMYTEKKPKKRAHKSAKNI